MGLDPTIQNFMVDAWNRGEVMRPSKALDMLREDPRRFLETYPLAQTVSSPKAGPVLVYLKNDTAKDMKNEGKNLNFRPGRVLGNLRKHSTEAFGIVNTPGNDLGTPFWVANVPTANSDKTPVWQKLDSSGPEIMMTEKITGCTFVARAGAIPGTVEVTHLQPTNESGVYLNARMSGPGNSAYGRLKYDYAEHAVNVIGVRRAGKWKIYAQKTAKNVTAEAVSRVIKVERIWPA